MLNFFKSYLYCVLKSHVSSVSCVIVCDLECLVCVHNVVCVL